MNLFALYVILISFLIVSCKSTDNNDVALNKLDAQSKIILLNEESKEIPNEMDIVILLSDELNDDYKISIEEKNVKIFAVTGKILTAKAKPDAVREILKLHFIKSIEINKKSSI
ncbi:MAG: hypothetical protein KIT33_06050 [Candidatus Kapabacteria bacterium]|nr:hypothetical protein [Ignavibacteriota bacterium]MCW5884518.1 hypothetical protein [Candidatus Kapabacteria bacterium]